MQAGRARVATGHLSDPTRKNMYAITYTLPKSKQTKRVYLGMDEEQSELYRLVVPGWQQDT